MPLLTRRGRLVMIGGTALLLAGFGFGVEEFVLFAVAGGFLVVFGAGSVQWRARRAIKGLRVSVRMPVLEVSTGAVTSGTLVVSNVGSGATPVVVIEDPRRRWTLSHPGLARRVGDATAGGMGQNAGWGETVPSARRAGTPPMAGRTVLPGLRPGTETTVAVPIPTGGRGLATLGPVGVWCTDPFGLFIRKVAAGPSAHVTVCPTADEAHETALPSDEEQSGRLRASGEAAASRTRAGDEFASLRPYVPGDRLTRLHWPALARTDTLIVREFVEPASGRITLLVDLRPSAHAGGQASAEAAISKAAGLGTRALDHGVSVELCTSAGERLEVTAGTGARATLLRALALLAPGAPPVSSTTWRWNRRSSGGAVWATSHIESSDLVLVTTSAGASNALPEVIRGRASTVVVS